MAPLQNASRLGLGTSLLRSAREGLDEPEAIELIRRARALGITLFDTAAAYGQGDAERCVGKAVAGRREGVVIATKVGLSQPGTSFPHRLKPLVRSLSGMPPFDRLIETARRLRTPRPVASDDLGRHIEDSLARLAVEQVDVLFLHNPKSVDRKELHALESALEQGLCRRLGVSVDSVEEARPWIQTGAVDVVQLPADIGAVPSLWALRADHDVTVIGRRALAGGRVFEPGWIEQRLRDLGSVAASIEADDPLSYVRWLVRSETVDHVLIGTTDPDHLVTAADVVLGEGGRRA